MASLQIYDPFTDTAVETLFRQFLRPDRADRAAPQGVRVDVAENDKGYVVYAEIPGVKKDEIHVAIEGNQVTSPSEVGRRDRRRARVLRAGTTAATSTAASRCPWLDETAAAI
jgi:HSP20 family protein